MQESRFFPEIHGNFGFGCMRLPMRDGQVDYGQFQRMADAFVAAGFNYFDTAHGYINGLSETAIRDCVSARYDRSRFLLTNKLTEPYFDRQEDIRPFLEQQLALCGVDYFDFYLMHAQDHNNYPKFQRCRAYETAMQLKQEGLIRHLGISFHDTPEMLDRILTDHPEVEIVQIQFNYVDYEDPHVQSRGVYEVCERHHKPVIVMEPVKGGNLVNLPPEADRVFRALKGGSNASYAVRFAASFPSMAMVLSGMSNMEQMEDNLSAMTDFRPLNEAEMAAVDEVRAVFSRLERIPCTACRYCIEESQCPKAIRIPDLFRVMNDYQTYHNEHIKGYYRHGLTVDGHGRASECIRCGKCEQVCPQHLPIRELLQSVAEALEG